MRKYLFTIILFAAFSCNKIETQQTLNQDDINFIKSLKLLDDNETIYRFYSESKNEIAGNFFTDQRIATYWIDQRNSTKDNINFAYYKDIAKIDTIFNAGLTYSPYILVTKRNGSKFKVSVDGKKNEIKSFFEDVLKEWRRKS